MRALLVALAVPDPASLRSALQAALGATSVDLCQAPEAAVTWLENRPCDLVAIAGQDQSVLEALGRLRRVSRTLPLLALVPDASSREAGAAWLAGADEVVGMSALVAGMALDGLDDVRHPERDALRRVQRLWLAGPADALRQQLAARLGARFRDVGLTAEGLSGLTTQDVETPQSAALVVNATAEPDTLVLGVRRVKRTYPGLAVVVLADPAAHDAFRRAGADECVASGSEADTVLHAAARAQATCRGALELDVVRARETRLRALLEHLPEAVMLVSPEHAVLAVNLAALRLIGAQDARQVLGSPLTPWLDLGADQLDGAVALLDGVAGGATRDLVARTRHLAEARRLRLRAVPFQRESGGAPAALIVLREAEESAPIDTVVAQPASNTDELLAERAAWDAERHAWEVERAAFAARVEELATRADAVAALQAQLDEARAAVAAASDHERAETQLQARVQALGVDLDAVPALLDAAQRLAVLEQQEVPALLARAQAQQQAHEGQLARLRDVIAGLEAGQVATDRLAALEAAASRLQILESDELPAMRRALEEVAAERDAASRAAHEVRARVAALEAEASRPPIESLVSPAAPAPAAVDDIQRWMLEDVARVGIVRTTADGRIIEANDHAARLCGLPSAAALLAARHLPAGLAALADDQGDPEPIRFETCVQADGTSPRWIVGARMPALDGADDVTWLLAETAASSAPAPGSEAVTAVLSAVADECAALVEDGPTVARGPRAIDAAPRDTVASGALGRARVLLAQVSAFHRRHEGASALDDITTHLAEFAPLLARLATDDITWALQVPETPVHVCASPADVERCLTHLVATTRDALPLGGRLMLEVGTPAVRGVEAGDVRRPMVEVRLDAQGYGLQALTVPAPVLDCLTRLRGTVEVEQPDPLTMRVTLRLPRAFVIAHAA